MPAVNDMIMYFRVTAITRSAPHRNIRHRTGHFPPASLPPIRPVTLAAVNEVYRLLSSPVVSKSYAPYSLLRLAPGESLSMAAGIVSQHVSRECGSAAAWPELPIAVFRNSIKQLDFRVGLEAAIIIGLYKLMLPCKHLLHM